MHTQTIETENINAVQAEHALKSVAGIAPRAFWTAKAGNAASDYEDAFALGDDCLAIADGATESSFARLWALALAEGFASDPSAVLPCTTERLQTWCAPLQKTWVDAVPWSTLPWFAEDKARSGAFATLLGFQLQPCEERGGGENYPASDPALRNASAPCYTWRAFAIGDSCFFQIRDGVLHRAFPLEHSAQFDSRPILLSSNPTNNKRVWNDIMVVEGDYQAGDILLFATDALAKWLLARTEVGERPWDTLCGLNTPEEFETFVTQLRHDRMMRNDDVTLVIVGDTTPIGATALTPETSVPAVTPHEDATVLYAGTPSELSIPEAIMSDQNGITRQETGITLALEQEQSTSEHEPEEDSTQEKDLAQEEGA